MKYMKWCWKKNRVSADIKFENNLSLIVSKHQYLLFHFIQHNFNPHFHYFNQKQIPLTFFFIMEKFLG